MVVLERGFTVPLVAGEATVTVDPSGLTWCWRVTERTDSGGTVRYVSVPDSATTVEYVDLPDVDPTTRVAWAPASPEAAYQQALDNLDVETAVETYLLANPVSAPVSSVNGKVGAVVLGADDVGADPAGTAAGLVGALAIPDSADDVGAIPEPAMEGASGDVLVTDGAGGRTWATPDAGGVTSVDGQTGDVSLSSTYVAQFVVDDFDNLLARCDRLGNRLACGLILHLFDERAGNGQGDVGFEQSHADFAQGCFDIFVGERALFGEAVEDT